MRYESFDNLLNWLSCIGYASNGPSGPLIVITADVLILDSHVGDAAAVRQATATYRIFACNATLLGRRLVGFDTRVFLVWKHVFSCLLKRPLAHLVAICVVGRLTNCLINRCATNAMSALSGSLIMINDFLF